MLFRQCFLIFNHEDAEDTEKNPQKLRELRVFVVKVL